MGLFPPKTHRDSPPERSLCDVADVLREFDVSSVAELMITLEAFAGVEDDLFLQELPDGGLHMQLGNDSYSVLFPTTRSALIYQIVAADEEALGFESTRGRQDWDLMDDLDD